MRRPFVSDVSEQLALALDKLDETGASLDRLKVVCHESSRELNHIDAAELCKVATPLPPPMPTGTPPNPTGYSGPVPKHSERPFARPKVPRPEPKLKVVPTSRPSLRFYVQIDGGAEAIQDLRSKLGSTARILDSGSATVSNPESGWVEIATRGNALDLVKALSKIEIKEKVEKVIEIAPGEGRLLARQCDLYALKRTKPVPSEP